MITLTQLEYALSVEKHRHFGRASASCHVTQPTLSQQLQKLEDEIGMVLFDRVKKPILPTQEGKRFLEQARAVMREHQKLVHVSKQVQEGEIAGDFRLAVIPTISSHLLPRFLKSFSKALPRVELFIEEMKTETILNELQNDRLDGAILATPIQGADFKVHPLYYEPFFVYLSPGHPLLKKSQVLREDLDTSQMWLLQDGHCFKGQVLNFCSLPPDFEAALTHIHFQSGSLDTLRRLVRANRGFTLIPAMMAVALEKKEFDAHVRPFRAPIPVREVSFVYRRDHWKLEIIKAIEEAVSKTLPAEIHQRRERNEVVLEFC
ncbi:hydrogen peroxide-inducible genes activator [Bdellovibrionota bacterium FG-1]